MTKDGVYEFISRILQDKFDIDAEIINLESRLYEDLDIDSIDVVDLILQIKPLLEKPLNIEDFRLVRSVKDMVEVIHQLVNAESKA